MTRYADWPSRLYAALAAKQNIPFAWGSNDCLMFCADVVLAMTGFDHAENYRGNYSTEAEAQAIINTLTGASDVVGVIDTLFKRVPVLQARRGDLVAATVSERGPSIGVCAGGGCFFVGPGGLIQTPLQGCITAWRVC